MHQSPGAPRPDSLTDDLSLLADLLDASGIAVEDAQRIRPRDPRAAVPMSFSQELLWMLDRATPGMIAYNMPVARRLLGALDIAALEAALTTVVARHEVLRARFGEVDAEPRLIIDPVAPVAVRIVDVGEIPVERRNDEALRVVRERAAAPFDLSAEHMFRVTLVRLAAAEHILVLELHHIVADGWSLGVLYRELGEAYAASRAGREPVLGTPSVQFGDYAIWQREQLTGTRLARLLEFWRAHLGPASEPLALPTDFPRAATPTFAGARETITVPPDRVEALRRLASANDATLYMVLLAAYATVLHRYTGREDVLVGSGSAGRSLPETEGLVGYLNNTLVQRADFSGDPTFAALLQRVRDAAVAAYDHQEIPLEKLVMELRQGAERLRDAPLFEVVLTMQDTVGVPLALDGLEVQPLPVDIGATKFDITLLVSERGGALRLTAQYRSDLFSPESMRRLLGHLSSVLDSAVNDPQLRISALPLLSADERRQLDAWNDTACDEGSPSTAASLFEAQAARVPSHVAVVASDGRLTYAELDARSNQLARRLERVGVRPNDAVLIGLDRSCETVVALMGVLKAGACYVPVPQELPVARRDAIVRQSRATVVITSGSDADAHCFAGSTVVALDRDAVTIAGEPATRVPNRSLSDAAAYVLFTSGSTGTPKGVVVSNANLAHYVRAVSRSLTGESGVDDAMRALDALAFATVTTLGADLGNTALFGALLTGGTVHVIAKDVANDPDRFAEYLSAHPIDVLKITPGHIAALVAGRNGAALSSVLPRRCLVLGGEALRFDLAEMLVAAEVCRVLNHYGPTEATVGACTFHVTRESLDEARRFGASTVPVGKPLANSTAYVVDASREELPVSIPGELLLGGAGVATGYLGRPDLTADRFIAMRPDDESSRVYRTGDRVRRLPDGSLEFLGRVDDQVKVRGYRVELGDVEQALMSHGGVAEATVIVVDDASGARLVGYAVPRGGGYATSHTSRVSAEALLAHLEAMVPEYMVPSAIVILDALPRTSNGKVDRRALPAPETSASAPSFTAPTTSTEIELATIWRDVLKADQVGTTDNFLALGGHSLMAIRVLGRISRAFGVRLPLRTLFDAPTIAQLATIVDAERGRAAPASGTITPRSRDAYRLNDSMSTAPGISARGES